MWSFDNSVILEFLVNKLTREQLSPCRNLLEISMYLLVSFFPSLRISSDVFYSFISCEIRFIASSSNSIHPYILNIQSCFTVLYTFLQSQNATVRLLWYFLALYCIVQHLLLPRYIYLQAIDLLVLEHLQPPIPSPHPTFNQKVSYDYFLSASLMLLLVFSEQIRMSSPD